MSTTPHIVPMPARQIRTLAQLAVEQLDAELAVEAAARRLAAIRDAIREHPDTHGPDKYAAGDRTIVISPNTRFNAAAAEAAVRAHAEALGQDPDAAVALVQEPRDPIITRKRVEVLYPQIVEDCIDVFDDKVSVK